MSTQRFTDFERFADEVARLRGRMRALYADTRAASGIAEMELTVLTAAVNAADAPTVAQIGRSLGHPRQVVQRAANALAERGLVTFADNPDHKRASLIVRAPRLSPMPCWRGSRARPSPVRQTS
jgi:DNA-binding MarR family transcriptional regulator